MGDGEDGAAEGGQELPDDRAGQGREVPGGFVQQKDIGLLENHVKEENLGLLPAGELGNGMLHLQGGESEAAQIVPNPGGLRPAAGVV